ncbi:DUF6122 family protein [Chryseobacterium sp.]|uniref:DUF6122 family protein n=1 Tax=Chryseobacterium sp. TaxID=1871047 RepID=UPI0029394CB4|nr:DUF6122 family protein [Chryseobacterium sp.]
MMEDLYWLRSSVHYFLHFVFPFFLAITFFKPFWRKAYLIMIATMLVDLDHLLANPVFDPDRSSVGFHILHSYPMVAVYFLGVVFLKGVYRVFAVGLLFHMFTDFQDYHLWKLIQDF